MIVHHVGTGSAVQTRERGTFVNVFATLDSGVATGTGTGVAKLCSFGASCAILTGRRGTLVKHWINAMEGSRIVDARCHAVTWVRKTVVGMFTLLAGKAYWATA